MTPAPRRSDPERRTAHRPAWMQWGAALRQAAGYAELAADQHGVNVDPGQAVVYARRLRVLALMALDRAVVAECERGTPWSVIAAAYGQPEEWVRDKYETDATAWLAGEDVPHPGNPPEVAGLPPTSGGDRRRARSRPGQAATGGPAGT